MNVVVRRKKRRNIVEKAALAAILIALSWLGLNAALAQLQKEDGEALVTPRTITLTLDAGDQRVVYVRDGASTDAGLGVTATEIQCRFAPAEAGEEGEDPASSDDSLLGERRADHRTLDGWNRWNAVLGYTAPEAGTYALTCADSFAGLPGDLSARELPGSFGELAGGVELRVVPPKDTMQWVSPYTALVYSFSVVAAAGLVYVVAGAFGRSNA
jgi:hypothetical protein